MRHGTEVLRAKEALVVGVVKSLDDTVAPRLALGDKDNLDPEMKTEPDQETEAPGKAIRSSEGEFIIDLQIAGDPQTPPFVQQGSADSVIMLLGDGAQGNSIAARVDKMDTVEKSPVQEVARPHQVQLLEHPRSFWGDFRVGRAREPAKDRRNELVAMNDAVNRPGTGKGMDTKSADLPLNGDSSALSIFLPEQSLPDFTDQLFDVPRKLAGLMVGST
jgi:hypothetical protein